MHINLQTKHLKGLFLSLRIHIAAYQVYVLCSHMQYSEFVLLRVTVLLMPFP
jgi:hypothetical protein